MINTNQITLIVTNIKKNDKSELIKNKFPIEIGRNINCDIPLEDERKLVSRKHAKIICSENNFSLLDLGSRNATFLNNEKILPEKEYPLTKNDVIKIGEFLIEIFHIQKQDNLSEDSQKTMIFSSPFAKEVKNLANSLQNLSDTYSNSEDPMREEYLKMDFLSHFSDMHIDNIKPTMAEYISDIYPTANVNNKWAEIPNPQGNSNEQIFNSKVSENKSVQENHKSSYSINSQFSHPIDNLLESISNLIQGFWHFRQEFFGVTIYQSIPITSVDELKKYLFDPTLSKEESKKRLENFNEELSKVQSHQVGLLDGYKDSINDGIEHVLKELNPEIIADKIKNEKFKIGSFSIPFKYIPFYAKIKSMQMVKSIHKKIQFDIGIIERKHFRPAFMKGYQKRINI